MDAYDLVSEEFASASLTSEPVFDTSKRERSAIHRPTTSYREPTAQKSPSASLSAKTITPKSKGRQSAQHLMPATNGMPTAENSDQILVSPTPAQTAPGRRRQAKRSTNTVSTSPAGISIQNSDGPFKCDTPVAAAIGGDGAHLSADAQATLAPVVTNSESRGFRESHHRSALGVDEGAQVLRATPPATSPLVAEITQLWRMRQRWHRAEKSLVLQGKAVCRSWTAGDKDEAGKLYDLAAKGGDVDAVLEMALLPFREAADRFSAERAAIERRLRKLAQSSPLWPWAVEVKGFGPLNLAAVIGEAGEIAAYRNPSCLWKRMGLAVIDGGRQRRMTGAEDALRHGYAPARRCVAYLLGDTLIKSGDACRYRPVYTARREHTVVTHADWTKAHSHNDAARYMVKRVLRELWSEARRLNREDA